MNGDAVVFFDKAPELLPLYAALEDAILARCPDAQVMVMKSQIAFTGARRFAFASLRGRRLIVTFGLPYRVESPRIWQAVEPCLREPLDAPYDPPQQGGDRRYAPWLD